MQNTFNRKNQKENRENREKMKIDGKKCPTTVIFDQNGDPHIPDFHNIPVSTMTIIAHTNLTIDTDKLFQYIPITDYIVVGRKRGRRKKIQPEDPNKDIPPGSVISITRKNEIRGVGTKQKRKKTQTFFRHSVSISMILQGGKSLNVKVSQNGKLQMTGCKKVSHAVEFVKNLYSLMIEMETWTGEPIFNYEGESDGLVCIFKIAMRNIDFSCGYKIRRNLLSSYINKYTDFRSIFESSIGTGVNIKVKAERRFDANLTRLCITSGGECIEDTISYDDFMKSLPPKEVKDQLAKDKYHTFLCFASGSIIMSSAGCEMPLIFYKLVKILVENRYELEDREEELNIKEGEEWIDEGDNINDLNDEEE